MLKQNEQNALRSQIFTDLQSHINNESVTSLTGYDCEGQSSEGLLLYNSEHDQWALIKCIFKKDGFDGVDAIEAYREKQEEQAEKARKKAEKVAKIKAKKDSDAEKATEQEEPQTEDSTEQEEPQNNIESIEV